MTVFLIICFSVLFGRCLTQDSPGLDHTSTQSQIKKLSEKVDFLKSALEQLILKDTEKEKILTELQSDNAELLQRVERLESINAKLEKSVPHTNEIEESSETYTPLNSTDNSDITIPPKDLGQNSFSGRATSDKEIKWISKTSKRLQERDVERRAAFSARYTDPHHTFNVGQTIVFDYIYTNIGGRYNSFTGVFTVDTAGVYVFFVNIICQPQEGVSTELVKDGTPISYQYCAGNVNYDNGSNMVVVELPVGVSMWVRTRLVKNNNAFELSTETTFTGFLLYAN